MSTARPRAKEKARLRGRAEARVDLGKLGPHRTSSVRCWPVPPSIWGGRRHRPSSRAWHLGGLVIPGTACVVTPGVWLMQHLLLPDDRPPGPVTAGHFQTAVAGARVACSPSAPAATFGPLVPGRDHCGDSHTSEDGSRKVRRPWMRGDVSRGRYASERTVGYEIPPRAKRKRQAAALRRPTSGLG